MCVSYVLQARIDFREDELPRARAAFYKYGSQRVRSMMFYCRRLAMKVADADSLMACIDGKGRPTWLPQQVWEDLIRGIWGTEEFQAASERAILARNTEINGVQSRHRGGAIPFEAREAQLVSRHWQKLLFAFIFMICYKHYLFMIMFIIFFPECALEEACTVG